MPILARPSPTGAGHFALGRKRTLSQVKWLTGLLGKRDFPTTPPGRANAQLARNVRVLRSENVAVVVAPGGEPTVDRDERRPRGIKGNHAAYCCQRPFLDEPIRANLTGKSLLIDAEILVQDPKGAADRRLCYDRGLRGEIENQFPIYYDSIRGLNPKWLKHWTFLFHAALVAIRGKK